jgi:hypothetical protein
VSGQAATPEEAMEENAVGRHTTYFEEPDIIFMRLIGEVSKAEGLELNQRHRDFGHGRHHVFFLIDLERLQKIDPEVRRVATETLRDVPLRGIALYRAPLKAKVIAKLIITALNMFKKDAATNPVLFASTEEEARAWIAARRLEILSAA